MYRRTRGNRNRKHQKFSCLYPKYTNLVVFSIPTSSFFFQFILAHLPLTALFRAGSCVDIVLDGPGRVTQNTHPHKFPSPSSSKMKILYNLGGISHARDALRVDHRSCKQKSYTSSKKMRIVQAVDRLVEEENLHQNVAAASRCA
jgi:hypothetical protein